MKVLIGSTRTLMKIGFLAAAVVVATLGVSQQPNAESASNTQIVFSYSGTSPEPTASIIINPGGAARDVYIWAIDVKNTTGVSAFNLAIQYDQSAVTATYGFGGDPDGIGDKTWLQSTGRSGACIPDPDEEPGILIGLCSTLTPPPPLGPTGSGLIGHILLWPNLQHAGASDLTFVPFATGVQGTFLLDTPFDPDDIQHIPLTLMDTTVVYLGCADNSPPPMGDGVIDLPNDILGVILRFAMTYEHPDWISLYDLNDDGVIDLPNDILGTILQFQLPCTQS